MTPLVESLPSPNPLVRVPTPLTLDTTLGFGTLGHAPGDPYGVLVRPQYD